MRTLIILAFDGWWYSVFAAARRRADGAGVLFEPPRLRRPQRGRQRAGL